MPPGIYERVVRIVIKARYRIFICDATFVYTRKDIPAYNESGLIDILFRIMHSIRCKNYRVRDII